MTPNTEKVPEVTFEWPAVTLTLAPDSVVSH